jgi:hypothetical protein
VSAGCSSGYGSATDLAEMPGSGGVAHRTPVDLPTGGVRVAPLAGLALAACLLAAWLIVDPRTPDLAAQVYRVGLFRRLGFAVWDEHWYAGHHLPGYSLLFGPLAVLLGMRLLACLAVLASTLLFARLVRRAYGERASWAAAPFALAAVGDVWAGRLTFALGVAFALAAALALARKHELLAAALAAACAAASPVAAVLLGLAALTLSLSERSPRALLALALPGALVLAPLTALFPEGGFEPYPLASFAATALVVLAFLAALPAGAGLLRCGGALYLAACLLCLLVRSPMGSNIERYGVLLAAPLLAASWLAARSTGAARIAPRQLVALVPALAVALLWVVWGPARETLAVAGSPATSAAYYAPVERFLASERAAGPVRVEVPLTRSHWEAALLAPGVSLARGWEKQLDSRFDAALLSPRLDARAYEAWLHREAVAYVALPDVPLDPSSAREGRLIRAGLPFLRLAFASAHWRIYRVADATPLASGPGRLTRLGHDSFTLQAAAAGRFLVRVRFTRYWTFVRGRGCVRPAAGGWTQLDVDAPGSALIAARFSLARAFASGGSCGGGGRR